MECQPPIASLLFSIENSEIYAHIKRIASGRRVPFHVGTTDSLFCENRRFCGEKAFSVLPSIVANIQKGAKYLRADIQLMTQEEDGVKEIERHAAALRHELFLLISDQEGSTLKDSKGKEEFRKSALKALQKVMLDISGKELVEELFFSSFFVQ